MWSTSSWIVVSESFRHVFISVPFIRSIHALATVYTPLEHYDKKVFREITT